VAVPGHEQSHPLRQIKKGLSFRPFFIWRCRMCGRTYGVRQKSRRDFWTTRTRRLSNFKSRVADTLLTDFQSAFDSIGCR